MNNANIEKNRNTTKSGRIFRQSINKDFTVIQNKLIQDSRLSFKARGLLIYLLHLPPHWKIYKSEVLKQTTDTDYSIRSAFQELMKHGYMFMQKSRRKGKFTGWDYFVFDSPRDDIQLSVEDTKQPLKRIGKENSHPPKDENQLMVNLPENEGFEDFEHSPKVDIPTSAIQPLVSTKERERTKESLLHKDTASGDYKLMVNIYIHYFKSANGFEPDFNSVKGKKIKSIKRKLEKLQLPPAQTFEIMLSRRDLIRDNWLKDKIFDLNILDSKFDQVIGNFKKISDDKQAGKELREAFIRYHQR